MNNIDPYGIISFEDISLPFGKLNILLFTLSSSGFLLIFANQLVESFFGSADRESGLNNLINLYQKIVQKISSSGWYILLLIIVIILFLIFQYCTFQYISNQASLLLTFSFIILLTIAPIIYIMFVKQRKLILTFLLVFNFLWAYFFVGYILEESASKPQSSFVNVKFDYDNSVVQTSDSLFFIYHGYKYLILKSSKGESILYPADKIGSVTFLKPQ
ncbi:hypothetical protein RCC89_13185 [Cytophagaceae bacterium ABcell3]|nr:hypothetical protein RCC89_13185 [Cytophagaceae bacterium ABcell3]